MLKAIQIDEACYKYIKNKLRGKYIVHQNVKIQNNEYDMITMILWDW